MKPIDPPRPRPRPQISRRSFIKRAGLLTGVVASAPNISVRADLFHRTKRIALLGTVVRKHSHAQHFIDRFLEGYGWEGAHYRPKTKLVSLYIDQTPESDLSRDRARRHPVTIYPSVEEALTLGGSKLAVDGVVIIAEHGRYPRNDFGQTLYPRYAWFKRTVNVFNASGRAVPVFNDKHLSTNWKECSEMVEDSRRMGFAFMAGSSLPVTWRIPSLEIPQGAPMVESVAVCYGGIDSYDIHGLETAQCMSERRAGGEVGVRSVQAFRGPSVFQMLEPRANTRRLLLAALARSHSLAGNEGYSYGVPEWDWLRSRATNPVAYVAEHLDGFRTTLVMLNGLVQDFTYAGLLRDSDSIVSCQMHLPMPGRVATQANFFNPLVHHIERMILEKRATYPVERNLLTSGINLFSVESLHRGGSLIATPQLDVAYAAPRASNYWRA